MWFEYDFRMFILWNNGGLVIGIGIFRCRLSSNADLFGVRRPCVGLDSWHRRYKNITSKKL